MQNERLFIHRRKIEEQPETQSNPDESIISKQNNWHESGNNGCIFSQIIAQKTEEFHWKADIAPPIEAHLAAYIDQTIETAINDPDIRLLSILFPEIRVNGNFALVF